MLEKAVSFLILFFLFLTNPISVAAAENHPASEANNKYGIHITDESDLKSAAELVNSSGGDWGYATLVIREDERDTKRWQNFFDEMRRLHLIPIVRIASKQGDGFWTKLNLDEIDGWVGFFNSLNWVVQNRYIIVGNEVNLGHEWGGKADPKEYADYLDKFTQKLKSANSDYFIMAAGLDSNAKNNKTDMDENSFLIKMTEEKPGIWDKMDGFSSHSYPYKPLSSKDDNKTLKHFEWELNTIKFLGAKKQLPVFITETGWMKGKGNYTEAEIAAEITSASESVWNDPKVVAVTPFVLDYTAHPFDAFSWIRSDGSRYSFFYTYKNIPKLQGTPKQIVSGEIISQLLPRLIRTKFDNIYGFMYVKNTGQTIWKGYEPILLNLNGKATVIKPITILSNVEPGQKALVVYTIR